MCEATLVSWLDEYGMLPKEDRAWTEDTLDPIGGYTDTSRGLLFALVGMAGWDTLLATGEGGTYGVDACFVDASTKKTTRDANGERVTEVTQYKFLCVSAEVGAGQQSEGKTVGLGGGLTFFSFTHGQEKGSKISLGVGPSAKYMKTYNNDGSTDTTVEIPIKLPKGAPQVLKTVAEWAPMPSGTIHTDAEDVQRAQRESDYAVQRFAHARGF